MACCVFSTSLLLSDTTIPTHVVGSKNKDCLCATCERRSRGGYSTAPREADETPASEQVSDSESSECSASEEEPAAEVNVNERRTRRGVYHVVPKEEFVESDGEDSEDDMVEAGKLCQDTLTHRETHPRSS